MRCLSLSLCKVDLAVEWAIRVTACQCNVCLHPKEDCHYYVISSAAHGMQSVSCEHHDDATSTKLLDPSKSSLLLSCNRL